MTSAQLGSNTSEAEITNVSRQGFWLLLGDEELFVAFKDFPWFAEAPIGKLTHVELPQPHHLYWPELDVDLAVESLRVNSPPLAAKAVWKTAAWGALLIPRPLGRGALS